ELHTLHWPAAMTYAHDFTVIRPRRDLERVGHRVRQDDQRVVACRRERIRQAGEDPAAVMADLRSLAVHLRLRARHRRAEGLADGLVAEAHTEDRRVLPEAPYEVQRDPRVVRGAGTGRDHDALRCERGD